MNSLRLIPALALVAAAAFCQTPATLTVQGLGGKSVTLTVADLARLPQQTVKFGAEGAQGSYECVLLTDVLAKVDLPLGDKFHSTAASYYLLVEARDHYRAVFAWAEVDAGFMDKPIYVAIRRDGKPLPDAAGPFQLIVPGEKRQGRSVRQLTALRVRQPE